LEKYLILGLGQEIDNMSLGHLVVTKSKEALIRNTMVGYVRDTRAKQMSSRWSELEEFKQQNKVLLYHNQKYKVNIHEYGLI